MDRLCPVQSGARSLNFSTLPLGSLGKASTKCTSCGRLSGAIFSAMRDHALGGDLKPGAPDRKGNDSFPPARIRRANDGGFQDSRMARQRILNLARVDVLAARDDHVLTAVHHEDEAFVIAFADIASVQIAAAQRLKRRRMIVPVPRVISAEAANHDFAGLASRTSVPSGRAIRTSQPTMGWPAERKRRVTWGGPSRTCWCACSTTAGSAQFGHAVHLRKDRS